MLGEGGTALSKLREAVHEFCARNEGKGALPKLEEAVREFQASEDRPVDLKGLREAINMLKAELASVERVSCVYVRRSANSSERDRH